LGRGEAAQPVLTRSQGTSIDTRPVAIEDRDQHGLPRLRE
jgi:HemY protein